MDFALTDEQQLVRDDHPVERWFRDVRVTTLYEGTSQIQKLIIGRALTGINALVPA
jgi:butyryl-CoA dehydrogenase